ncbi:phosphoribosyltransferase [Hoyosella sp. G463]|uniref:Phosphoribosyltransferase n=1 Tax=Lolliginicoccus lacisalsi TaxID=2742202 RepID=A0A927JES8_9ACTN|nr:phosphoribosyltransferase family protein [Lolliginicoccus lacisalsi]MBD8507808.1 phosphoribosyltransferase [Lolliginicoccus lacisalsi]
MRYRDREHAGNVLADALGPLLGDASIVLGLPRGGVPVGAIVAERAGLPLDILMVRKLGVPRQPELAFGALGEDGTVVLNEDLIAREGLSREDIDAVRERELAELSRRAALFRRPAGADGHARMPVVDGQCVIIVDDGIATGATMLVACQAAARQGARRVIAAAPVAASQAIPLLERGGAEVVSPLVTDHLDAVGAWYDRFDQVPEREVQRMLADGSWRGSRS